MKNNKAFTLIEVMVTVVIIAILVTMITVNLQSAKVKSRDVERKADMEAVAAALEIFYAQNKTYPVIANGGWEELKKYSDEKEIFSPSYISAWPTDPKPTSGIFPQAYIYHYQSDTIGGKYVLDAKLEGRETCDSSIELVNKNSDNFYKTGIACDNDNKNHYRIAGR